MMTRNMPEGRRRARGLNLLRYDASLRDILVEIVIKVVAPCGAGRQMHRHGLARGNDFFPIELEAFELDRFAAGIRHLDRQFLSHLYRKRGGRELMVLEA